LNFIEKNETTEIISYIGPEFYIYDDKQRKDETKLKELFKKEEAFFSNNEVVILEK
jgi:hypothetical protein